MSNLAQFNARFGDPLSYRYNGKHFDTGTDGKMHCDVCNRIIRYVYIVVMDGNERQKLQVGSCEIATFATLGHEKLAAALTIAKAHLEVTVEAKEFAIKMYGRRDERRDVEAEWRKIKRLALGEVRKYRKNTGKTWVPETVFELEQIAKQLPPTYKKSGLTIRWFESQISKMQEQIAKLSV